MTIFNEYLSKNEPILIMIRDVPTDEKNPFTAHQVMTLWNKVYKNEIKYDRSSYDINYYIYYTNINET